MTISRRNFLVEGVKLTCLASFLGLHRSIYAKAEKSHEFEVFPVVYEPNPILFSKHSSVVSVVRVNSKWSESKGIDYATAKAIELIGGINEVAKGRNRILLKPNLVNTNPSDTTNPKVVEALAKLMKNAGKEVCIGEAGAASIRNIDTSVQGYVCRTKNVDILRQYKMIFSKARDTMIFLNDLVSRWKTFM